MTGLKLLAGVALGLFLLGLIRLGGAAEYSEEGLSVKFRIGQLRFRVFPVREKKEKKAPKKKKKKKPQEEKAPKAKRGGPLELVKRYLPLICEAAGELKRKIRIDQLYLDLVIASGSASGTAMAFGYSNMALGMIWPLIEQNFDVRDPRIRTGADFSAQSTWVYINAAFSARLGQLVSFALRFGWKFLRIYLKNQCKNTERGDLT